MKTIKKTTLVTLVTLVTLMFITPGLALAHTGQHGENAEHESTLQVIAAVKENQRGRIIKAERKSTKSHPNCHVIKMKTDAGEFKVIRYACP